MPRTSAIAILLLFLFTATARADETDVKGKVTAIDIDKRTISLTIDDKDKTYEITKECKVYKMTGKGKKAGYSEDANGLKDITVGAGVTATTDFIDGKDQVIRIKLDPAGKKKKKQS